MSGDRAFSDAGGIRSRKRIVQEMAEEADRTCVEGAVLEDRTGGVKHVER